MYTKDGYLQNPKTEQEEKIKKINYPSKIYKALNTKRLFSVIMKVIIISANKK